MAELETNEIDNEIVDNTEVTETSTESDEITYDTAMGWKGKADRLDKAEKRLVELKKQLKEQEAWKANDSNYITKEDLAIEKFIAKNPDLEDYKEALAKYSKDWLSLKQAKLLIENDDKTIENRKKTNSINMTNWESTGKTKYSVNELEKMNQSDYNKVMDRVNTWKASIG